MAVGDETPRARAHEAVFDRFKEAIVQSDEALKLFIDRNDSSSQAGIWVRSAEAQLEQGHIGDALPILIHAEHVLAGGAAHVEHLRALAALARAYELLGDHHRARLHADAALALAQDMGARGSMPDLLGWSSRIHESLGDLQLALRDERWRQALEDSLMDERVAERMAGMQELYQLDHKEKELDAMRSRFEASEEMIAQGRAHGRWWLAVFVVLFGSLIWSTWALLSRRKAVRRIRLKNQVIRQQSAQIHANNLELERRNLRLAESLMSEEEKGALLKEIHHRVKNNLQIVNALLRLQSENVQDDLLADMLRDAQGRVRAMAMVHENLYRLGDLSRIDMRSHLLALGKAVIESHRVTDRVVLEVNTQLDRAPLDTMLPLSLLVNELVTNAAKHAFPDGRKGTVRLVINRAAHDRCELFYSDDGVGMRHDRMSSDNFGMSLIRSFVQQLDGNMRMVHGEGTTMVITFDPEPRRIRQAS
jgi:two-component sensor histidine kinase